MVLAIVIVLGALAFYALLYALMRVAGDADDAADLERENADRRA